MSTENQKLDIQSVSSLSIDPNLRDQGSNIFGGRKSSFDIVNMLKDSDQLPRKDYRNSLDILASNINSSKPTLAPIRNIIQLYNKEEDKVKIEQQGFKALEIGEVYSQSEEVPEQQVKKPEFKNKVKLQTVFSESQFNYHSYFPHDLAEVLKERKIPLQYVRGLLMVKNQKDIKTTRRLKVQRYLEKRRKKTWNRKICYNCRQKVAEQRLRIKGKFIKKRRAMQILGLMTPTDVNIIKKKLYAFLQNKNNEEIQLLINNGKQQLSEEMEEDYEESMYEESEQNKERDELKNIQK